MWVITSLLFGVLCYTAHALRPEDGEQFSLLREIFADLGENPGVLEMFGEELSQYGVELPKIADSYLVDNSSGCLGCIDAVNRGNAMINQPGPGYPVWRPFIIQSCKSIMARRGADGEIICPGLCDNYGPHVFDIFRAREFEGRFVCEFLNNCDRPEVFEPVPEIHRPEVLQNRKQKRVKVPENALKVAMVTDVHIEPRYAEGAAVECDVWVCCVPSFPGTGSARYWGEYACNTALHTLEVFLDQVAELQPDVVLYGGDGPPHALWDETQVRQLNMTSWIAKQFTERLPGVSVYPTLGNHDGFPANLYYIPREDTQEQNVRFGEDWAVAAGLGPDELETIHYSGYYTKEVVPGLRILSYNGNYGYNYNWYNLLSIFEDVVPNMFDWMRVTLDNARANGEKVILFNHFPLGNGDNIVEHGQNMMQLFIDYSDVITLQPVGHTHQAEIKLAIDDDGVARSMVYVTGSVTPKTNKNPSVRVFYLDPVTFEVLDYDQYYNDIGEQSPDVTPQLVPLYRASEEYDLVDLSPASWLDLTYRFEDDDVLWQSYQDNKNSHFSPGGICDTGCKHNTLCSMRSSDYVAYRRCVNDYVPE